MAKRTKAKPFFREQTKSWYVTLSGKQCPLGKDEDEAYQKYHRLMANYVADRPAEVSKEAPVAVLLNAFLDWTQRKRAPRTYDSYKSFCTSLAKYLPNGMTCSNLKPHHIESWFDAKFAQSGETSRGIAYRTIKRAFNWAVKQEYIGESPIRRLEVPSGEPREIYIEPEQFDEFIKHANPKLEEIATFLWNTGCRPFEAYQLESRHLHDGCCIFDRDESKGKRKRRVVPLDDAMWELVSRLVKEHQTGALFRNTKGRAWNTDSLNCAFDRIETKVNFKVYPYAFRHSFITRALLRGLNPIEVANIVGHTDLKMIHSVYSHLNLKQQHLRDKAAIVNVIAMDQPFPSPQPDSV